MMLTAIITTGVLLLVWLSALTPRTAVPRHFVRLDHASLAVDTSPPQASKTPPAKRNETEQDNMLRVETTLVTVPVMAMDRHGKFVPDLQAKNFHVLEEGIEQEIAFFSSAEEPA